ncbi:MAG: aminomethyl-transferring glycine dehydrogenase [Bacteroidales bacterium]|nr:aminomethyl-transferring glycine dehydrogenase [Bacteroidales bacterium]MDD4216276.1 aminomethyl-transferring glycine dehydrogenase [Bacteroidales bacterium]MDY0141577.1 aminomethyl-transferring glycine dehydrogenase [Bacteroidales bacterium]
MIKQKFSSRHIGPRKEDYSVMLDKLGVSSIDELMNQIIPSAIRLKKPLNITEALSEYDYLGRVKAIAAKNKIYRSFIGMGYYGTAVPSVILRNVFENPGWYTSYTPYQAEISQGRLEALLNFQTVITELTGMEIANSSLLDEGSAAAEAMSMMFDARSRQAVKDGKNRLFVDEDIFPQTLDVIRLRAEPIGVEVVTGKFSEYEFTDKDFGAVVQYPSASGKINNYSAFTEKAHQKDILVTAVVDIMSLALLETPANWGADIAVGSTQRFGIPMGYGGPHAAYLATAEKYQRNMPGRIIGISIDKHGNRALRMALQTREQHIKRERATSNICTAQALLATMAGMYAVYHGPKGMKNIANNIFIAAKNIACELNKLGYKIVHENFFDTLKIELPKDVKSSDIQKIALEQEMNFAYLDDNFVSLSTDEVINLGELNKILSIFAKANNKKFTALSELNKNLEINKEYSRTGDFMTQEVFNKYHSETEMMRYIKRLENLDIALNRSMISLGSCTMKLNSASSMLPLSWAEFGNIHPFVPVDQAEGYQALIKELADDLSEITGFADTSLQPNSGATGEHTGLMVIREYHISRGDAHRNVCLIPSSAHGTNPASAIMAGMDIVIVKCDENGNIDVEDLRAKAVEHKDNLAAIMITYPSTHGVFESEILEMVDIIHENGGQVYMDGANMNAQVGLTNPGVIGADVCHLNLHKTFAIPHGGGGPGVGPIGVAKHLVEFLPRHKIVKTGGKNAIKAVSAAPYGSAFVLPITYAYIKMLGEPGLKHATEIAMLNANYIANELKGYFEVLYTGKTGRCAHEMILDVTKFRQEYGVEAGDIARRLMDFGFHAPTLSFPVHETLMVEPTESESKEELDRFIEAMKIIKQECNDIKSGKLDKLDNPIKNAPHTQIECVGNEWKHSYNREKAAFPADWVRLNKFWPFVGKIDNAYGDRNLMCTCEPVETYM